MDKKAVDEICYFIDEYQIARTYHELILKIITIIRRDDNLRNWYLQLWLVTLRAYVSSMFLAISRFFDRHPKAHSFEEMIEEIDEADLLNRHNDLRNIWNNKGYADYRCKYVAHLDRSIKKVKSEQIVSLTIPEIEDLKSDELKSFLVDIRKLLSDIYYRKYNQRIIDWYPYVAHEELNNVIYHLKSEIDRQRDNE